MKTLFLFLFTSFYLFGQEVYYSPFTETYPNIFESEFFKINRRIVFEPNEVTIVTETKQGKDIEVLNIQEIEIIGDKIVLLCQNKSKQKITISIPEEQDQLMFIDYYYRPPKKNEEIQLRFHVEEFPIGRENPIKIKT